MWLRDEIPLNKEFSDRSARIFSQANRPAPCSERITGVSDCPLVVSMAIDSTAGYFFDLFRGRINWVQFEDLASQRINFRGLEEMICRSSGVYLRDAFTEDQEIISLNSMVKALFLRHQNSILVPQRQSNWCKSLHSEMICETLKSVRPPSSFIRFDEDSREIVKLLSGLPCWMRRGIGGRSHGFPFLGQEEVIGDEVRVHLVDGEVFASRLQKSEKGFFDYRLGGLTSCSPVMLSEEIVSDLVLLATNERLRFAGIDLFLSVDDCVIIEANPMPGYHSYEILDGAGPRISNALFNRLCR